MDWQKADWVGGRGAMSNPPPIDIFRPVYTGYTPVVRSVGLSRGSNEQAGAYLQDQMAFGNWRVLLGGRYDRTDDDTATATYTPANGRTTPWARTRLKNDAFTGRAGEYVPVAETVRGFREILDGRGFTAAPRRARNFFRGRGIGFTSACRNLSLNLNRRGGLLPHCSPVRGSGVSRRGVGNRLGFGSLFGGLSERVRRSRLSLFIC